MSAAWTVSGYELEDLDLMVFGSVNRLPHSEHLGADWFLSVATGRRGDMDSLSGTRWPTAEAAMEAVAERMELASIEAQVDALGIPGGTS